MSAICISIPTMPRRRESFQRALQTLVCQTRRPDRISIFLDEFPCKPPPPNTEGIPCIIVEGALAERGKFSGCDEWDGYWVGADDDILYPPDYVERLVAALERNEQRGVVGVHGTVFARPFLDFSSYLDSRIVFDYRAALDATRQVHMLGTGTIAFHTQTFRPDLRAMTIKNMTDVFFAVQAKAAGVPLFAIDRPKRWLTDASSEVDPDCIWMRKRRDPLLQARILETIRAAAPWPAFDCLPN